MTTTRHPTPADADRQIAATTAVAARMGVDVATFEEAMVQLRLTLAAHPAHPTALEELAAMTTHDHPHADPLVCNLADAIAEEFETPQKTDPPHLYAPRPGDTYAAAELAELSHRAARRAARILEDLLD